MDYCGPHGIPWEEFLGWSKLSRDAAILWANLQRQACPSCGTRADEWDPDKGGSDVAYRADIRACRGCETLASAQEQITDAHGKGAHVVLVPHERA